MKKAKTKMKLKFFIWKPREIKEWLIYRKESDDFNHFKGIIDSLDNYWGLK